MKIKLHKHLESKIWDKSENIKPIVSDMLLSIAWAYIDYVRNEYGMNIKNSDIADMFVFGSMTQYFYDNQSDIDLCIVLNLENIEKQFPNLDMEKQLKLYYYDWAMVHICKIYGHKIDLNFSDSKNPKFNGRHRRGPMYSLLRQEWLLRPISIGSDKIKKMNKESTLIYKQILRDYKTVKKNGFKLDEIQELYNNILASKEHCLQENPEQVISPAYMAIRKFKHDGYVKILHTKAVKEETAKYVLK